MTSSGNVIGAQALKLLNLSPTKFDTGDYVDDSTQHATIQDQKKTARQSLLQHLTSPVTNMLYYKMQKSLLSSYIQKC